MADLFLEAIKDFNLFYSSLDSFGKLIVNAVSTALILLGVKIFLIVIKKALNNAKNKHKKFTPLMCGFILKLIRAVAWVLALLIILDVWGIDLTPVIAGIGVTGVVLGFALQETIGSIFSGMMLALNSPFGIGDYVDIGSTSGSVVQMDIMSVTLRTPDNKKITLSNKLVWGQVIVNYSDVDKRRLDMSVGVAYGSDLTKTKEVILSVLDNYSEILRSEPIVVEVSELADSSIDFIVRPWVRPSDYWSVKWRFQKDIYEALNKAKIEIPYNKLDVTILNS